MASYHKRGAGYAVRWRTLPNSTGGRAQRSRSCPDLRTARRLVREIEQAQALGQEWEPAGPGPQRPDLNVIFSAFIIDRRRVLKARTAVGYADALGAFLAFAKGRPEGATLDALSRPMLAAWFAHLERVPTQYGSLRALSTTRRMVRAIQTAWSWAWEHDEEEGWGGLIPRPRTLEMPKPPRQRVTAPSWAQLDAVVRLAESEGLRPGRRSGPEVAPDWLLRILMVLRYTGMRRGAVVALSWADLDLDKNRLVVRPETTKGGHGGRVVPLIGPLRAYLDGLERIGPLVVAPPATGTHVGRQVRRLWRATGAPEEVWVGQPTKAFRKAVRTGLAVAGVQDRVIDRLLGHGPGSVGAAHYLDSRALDPQLAEAMAHVPEIGGEA